jgi:hypothetical protein
MARKTCIVALTDIQGMKHSVEVQADSLYEAAVRGLKALRDDGWTPHDHHATRLEIEVREPVVRHSIRLHKLEDWLVRREIGKDYARQAQLRELLYTSSRKPSTHDR